MIRENVVWKDIDNYEGLYQISSDGKIKNKYGRILKIFNKHGKKKYYNPKNDYKKVRLCKECKSISKSVHRLVAEAFVPNPENKPQINHKNGLKWDNRAENLEWCTNIENTIHYYRYLKKEKEYE